jgi:hypothetical protein
MKKILLISTFLTSISCLGQKQGRIWYFGIKVGIEFIDGNPINIPDGKTGTDLPSGSAQEGTDTICDSSGNLLFYTGGKTVWNRFHNPMPGGSGLFGGQSSTQSSLIIPFPGSENLFYLFTSDEFQNFYSPAVSKGYRYSVIDMCLDSSRGDVLTDKKNILLLDSCTEKLAACEDAAGKGYWLVGHKMFSNAFYAWHITSTGISQPVISGIGTIHGWDATLSSWIKGSAQGQLKLNPQGTRLALAIGNFDPAIVDLFDFDNHTGQVSNFCHIVMDSALHKRCYGVEFSPDGSKLYTGVEAGTGPKRIYQYNLSSGDCNSIINSKKTIYESTEPILAGMQMAVNNKIYIVSGSYHTLGCINDPNSEGTAVNYQETEIRLLGVINNYTFPAFIAGFKYHNKLTCYNPGLPADSSCRLGTNIKFYPNPFNSTLVIKMNPIQCKVTMQLYNSLGQLIIAGKPLMDGQNQIPMSRFPSGVYYYKLFSQNKALLSGRILKQ